MPIEFSCPCGKKFKVSDQLAGKKATCKNCGRSQLIPAPAAFDVGIVDAELADQIDLVMEKPVPKPAAKPAAKPTPAATAPKPAPRPAAPPSPPKRKIEPQVANLFDADVVDAEVLDEPPRPAKPAPVKKPPAKPAKRAEPEVVEAELIDVDAIDVEVVEESPRKPPAKPGKRPAVAQVVDADVIDVELVDDSPRKPAARAARAAKVVDAEVVEAEAVAASPEGTQVWANSGAEKENLFALADDGIWIDKIKPKRLADSVEALEEGEAFDAVFGPNATLIPYGKLTSAQRNNREDELKLSFTRDGSKATKKFAFASNAESRAAFDALADRFPDWPVRKDAGSQLKQTASVLGVGLGVLFISAMVWLESRRLADGIRTRSSGRRGNKVEFIKNILESLGHNVVTIIVAVVAVITVAAVIVILLKFGPPTYYTLKARGRD